jgi:LacI family transcriptional regulator
VKRTATIHDVARQAGVSSSTVSKILNNVKRFPPETESRVLQAAEKIGYIPNPHAKSVVTGKSHVIGVKILDITNPYFANVVKGIQKRAYGRGYSIIVADSQEDPATEIETIHQLAHRSDGLILAGSRLPTDDIVQLNTLPAPIILIGRSVPESRLPSIHSPLEERLHLAITHLIQLGHKHISLLLPHFVPHIQATLSRYSLDTITVVNVNTPDIDGGKEAAHVTLQAEARPSAIVGYNDLICYGVLKAARELTLSIPRELSVIGLDDLPFNDITSPPLTSISSNALESGAAAAVALLDWIEHAKPPALVTCLTLKLTLRASTGSPG